MNLIHEINIIGSYFSCHTGKELRPCLGTKKDSFLSSYSHNHINSTTVIGYFPSSPGPLSAEKINLITRSTWADKLQGTANPHARGPEAHVSEPTPESKHPWSPGTDPMQSLRVSFALGGGWPGSHHMGRGKGDLGWKGAQSASKRKESQCRWRQLQPQSQTLQLESLGRILGCEWGLLSRQVASDDWVEINQARWPCLKGRMTMRHKGPMTPTVTKKRPHPTLSSEVHPAVALSVGWCSA